MATDTELAKAASIGYISPVISTGKLAKAEIQRQRRKRLTFLVADAATAGTAVTETTVHVAPGAIRITAAYVTFPIAITGSDTVYATISLAKRTTAGASSTAVASGTTQIAAGVAASATIVALKPYALTLSGTAAALELADGEPLSVAIAKASTGTALTAATSYVAVTVEYEDI